MVAASRKEIDEIYESVALLKRDGFNYKMMHEKEMQELLSNKHFHGAAFNPMDGEINPVKLARGLIRMASEAGMSVFENSHVKRIHKRNNFIEIRTNSGMVKADHVVLATNAYTPLLHPYFKNIISPIRGQILVTRPYKKIFCGVFYANYGYEYWRQLPDGSVLAGGYRNIDPKREVGYRMFATKKIQRKLEELLLKLSVKSSIINRWSGIMGFTRDNLPLIGSVPNEKNMYISAGYSGHGLGFAFIAGRAISEKIVKGKDKDKILSYFNQCGQSDRL
ncbi:MAG: FAD-binding oxidoreductase [Nitrososphaerales archaeon]